VFTNCTFTNWNFDFIRHNGYSYLTTGRFRMLGCQIYGTNNARSLCLEHFHDAIFQNCHVDARTAYTTGVSMIGNTAQNSALTYRPTIAITSGTYTSSTTTVTKTGAFATYCWRQGDVLRVTGGTGVTTGDYPIISRTNNDSIVLAAAPVGSDISDLAATEIPYSKTIFKGGTYLLGKVSASLGLFRLAPVASVSNTRGVEVLVDGVELEVTNPAPLLVKAAAHAGPVPKPSVVWRNTPVPAGYTLSNVNATNCATLAMRGSSLIEGMVPVTDAATVTIDANRGATHAWTCTQNTSLQVSALSGSYYTGQAFRIVVTDAGAHTITPDGSTVKGATLTTVASKYITAEYEYNGSFWVQTAAQTTGY
jgi:hypothetical protein